MTGTLETLSSLFKDMEGLDRNQPGYTHNEGWNAALRYAMDITHAQTPSPPEIVQHLVNPNRDAIRAEAFEEAALLVEGQWNHCWPSDIAAAIRALATQAPTLNLRGPTMAEMDAANAEAGAEAISAILDGTAGQGVETGYQAAPNTLPVAYIEPVILETLKAGGSGMFPISNNEYRGAALTVPLYEAAPAPPLKSWRCFHCDQLMTTEDEARLHFGVNEVQDPICTISAERVRELELDFERHAAEDSDVVRQMYALKGDHSTALITEEQKGYDKGLADGRAERDRLLDVLDPFAKIGASVNDGDVGLFKVGLHYMRLAYLTRKEIKGE